jgi:hypothetical protein
MRVWSEENKYTNLEHVNELRKSESCKSAYSILGNDRYLGWTQIGVFWVSHQEKLEFKVMYREKLYAFEVKLGPKDFGTPTQFTSPVLGSCLPAYR